MIRKLSALALALALPALASASDINPGALQLSGKSALDWGATTVKVGAEEVKTTHFDTGLSAMYFVSHFLAFGLDVEYQHLKTGPDYESEFLFGPKAGIDLELFQHFSAFADLTVGIARGETMDGGLVDTADGFGYEAAAGFRLFMNRNVSLDLFGAVNQMRLDFPDAGKKTTTDLTMGIGLSVYLTNNPANSEPSEYRPPPRPEYR
ncbi:MAG TPA: outer membrane beta-barrel protein [Anaeromyxobacteraceae bacterium]|nr:outer membrane beta-barrel protein [Anaeromyxobacteraceae bacterium]